MSCTFKSVEQKMDYVFEEKCKDEFEAFRKYYETILENKYINYFIKKSDYMQDPCEMYPNSYKDLNNIGDNAVPIKKVNEKILYAHRSLEMRNDSSRGRYLVASSRLKKGTILVNENPTIVQVEPLCLHVGVFKKSIIRCHNCGIPVKAFLTCEQCDVVAFCDSYCKNAALEYHQYECHGLQRHFWSLNNEDKNDHSYMAMRLMMYGAKYLFEHKTDPEAIYGNTENSYPFIWNLESAFPRLCMKDINLSLKLITKNLVYLISHTDFLDKLALKLKKKLYDTYLFVGGVMMKHFCQAISNSITPHYPSTMTYLAKYFLGNSCKLICPTISLINHSCFPNSVLIPYANGVVIKCIEDIKKNEEITICYQGVDPFTDIIERKVVLGEVYLFDCECKMCSSEVITYEANFKCIECQGRAYQLLNGNSQYGFCFDCNATYSFDDYAKLLKQVNIIKKIVDKTDDYKMLLRLAGLYQILYHQHTYHRYNLFKVISDSSLTNPKAEEGLFNAIKYGLKSFESMEPFASSLNIFVMTRKLELLHNIINSKHKLYSINASVEFYTVLQQWENVLIQLKEDIKFFIPNCDFSFYCDMLHKMRCLLNRASIKCDGEKNLI